MKTKTSSNTSFRSIESLINRRRAQYKLCTDNKLIKALYGSVSSSYLRAAGQWYTPVLISTEEMVGQLQKDNTRLSMIITELSKINGPRIELDHTNDQ